MILPGLVSAVFYRRRPTRPQIALGLAFTIALSGLLGYLQDVGMSRVWLNVVAAIVGGVVLYVAILAYLLYRYFPSRATKDAGHSSPGTPPGTDGPAS